MTLWRVLKELWHRDWVFTEPWHSYCILALNFPVPAIMDLWRRILFIGLTLQRTVFSFKLPRHVLLYQNQQYFTLFPSTDTYLKNTESFERKIQIDRLLWHSDETLGFTGPMVAFSKHVLSKRKKKRSKSKPSGGFKIHSLSTNVRPVIKREHRSQQASCCI